MGTSTEHQPPGFDPSQPGIRWLQRWIRDRTPIQVELQGGRLLQGCPQWVDGDHLALLTDAGGEPLLVNRRAIAVIQALT
jgi:host factor-I protein